MGKAAQWIKNLLTGGRKERTTTKSALKETRSGPLPALGTRERRRWSFRRSATGQKSAAGAAARGPAAESDDVAERKRHSVDAAAAAAVRAAELSRRQQAAVIRLTDTAAETVEEEAAVKIQSFFRSYLARRALCALRGLVKMQALIRAHLVRRQTTATIRSMQSLATAQSRARAAQRVQMIEEARAAAVRHTQNSYRRSLHESLFRHSYEMEENVKIVEMDHGESRSSSKSTSSYMYSQTERRDLRLPTYYSKGGGEVSPAMTDLTDRSPRATSGRFEYSCDLSAKSQEYHPLYPNYMANTQSSRAKARSHSAPKQRPGGGSCERTVPSGRRPSVDGKNAVKGVRTRSIKLDRSSVSLQESECGSTSTKYCSRSLMAI